MTSLRGTTTATASSSTALTVTPVTGTAAGDLILIFAIAQAVTLSTLPGFATAVGASGTCNARAYARISTGSDGASFPITLSGGTTVGCAICAVYEAPAARDPAVMPSVLVNGANSTSVAVPAITLAASGDWLAWFGGPVFASTPTSITVTPPSGFTTQATIATFSNGTDSTGMIFADLETAQSSGSTGIRTGTLSTTEHNAGWLVGVNPAASALNSGAFLDFF